jgi:hypothetical protein
MDNRYFLHKRRVGYMGLIVLLFGISPLLEPHIELAIPHEWPERDWEQQALEARDKSQDVPCGDYTTEPRKED